MQITPDFQTAFDYMESPDHQVIFVTGEAGTGKSTLFRFYLQKTSKKYIRLAPTGLAAVNINGETIHNFFNLPLGIIQPFSKQWDNLSLSPNKVDLIRHIDGLIIDEISMVRSDVIDAIDFLLKKATKSKLPFGGKKLIMFGDLYQLEPIINKEASYFFKEIYDTHFFFGAESLRNTTLYTVNLNTVFRHTDPDFITHLNNIRNNAITKDTLDYFNSRYKPDGFDYDKAITLCTTNKSVSDVNTIKLAKLNEFEKTFEAIVHGLYDKNQYPAPELLKLKVGAQVMLLRNNKEKGYYNGCIGIVNYIGDNFVTVFIYDLKITVRVERVEWENIHYGWDDSNKSITQEVVGTFTQFPLQLAWAVTIHKSQGLTLDKVVIDLGSGAFCHGQLYVALSRCRTLENMALLKHITHKDVIFDGSINKFLNSVEVVN